MPDYELAIADKNFSSWSLRPWLVMKYAGIEFTERSIYLGRRDTAELIGQVSPSGWIPCLLVDGQPIPDSLAICEYLAETFPEKKLWPTDARARSVARSVTAEMHSAFRSFPTDLRMNITSTLPTPELKGRLETDVARIRKIWTDSRTEFGGTGNFLFGEFSIADAFFAPVVSRFTTYSIPVEEIEAAYMATIWSLPWMQEWKNAAKTELLSV